MSENLARRLLAEGLGTAFLLAAVVGSGIMGAKLAGGNVGLALLANTLATGAILIVLILIFGPVSGAHFNPAVSLAFALKRVLPWPDCFVYMSVQLIGAVFGTLAAHLMFELPLWQISTTLRTGPAQWFSESVATFGLLLTIFGCVARVPAATAYAVGLLYRRRLLVHRLDILCQSGGDHRARLVEHICGNCALWSSGLHPGADRRNADGGCIQRGALAVT